MPSPFDTLTEFLRHRPYGQALRIELDEQPRAVIPGKCAAVGDLVIYDDGDELTVYYGNFTHCHYGPAQFTGSEADWDAVTRALAGDLDALFSDQLILWGSHQSRGGIFRRGEVPTFGPAPGETKYVWSGPVGS
jgi:hypothetical protein